MNSRAVVTLTYRSPKDRFYSVSLRLTLSLFCIFDVIARRETAHRFLFAPEIQSTSLELNVRGWTPGVEPCAETKSSRHCHLGRDARVFTRWRVSILRLPFPIFCLVFPCILVVKRLPMSILRGPLFRLSGRCIRNQRDDFPTNLSSLSSPSKKSTSTGGENNTVKALLYAR